MEEKDCFNSNSRHVDVFKWQMKRSWYSNDRFPLLPLITLKNKGYYNNSGFVFKWLFFTLWNLDNVSFEISFVISDHWGIGIIGMLPYLRFCATVPIPRILYKAARMLQRKTDYDKEQQNH